MFWRVKKRNMIESVLSHTEAQCIHIKWLAKVPLQKFNNQTGEICNMQFYCVNWSTQCFSRLSFEVQTQTYFSHEPSPTDSQIEMFAFYIKKLMLDFRNQTLPRHIKWYIFLFNIICIFQVSLKIKFKFLSGISSTLSSLLLIFIFLYRLKLFFVFFPLSRCMNK